MDVFAPADDLAHEAFHGFDRRMAIAIGADGGADDPTRVDELQVQGRGQACVVQKRLSGPHRVLIGPECGQPVRDEVVQGCAGLLRCHRPVEPLQPARRLRKAPLHQLDDLAGDSIGRKAFRRGDHPRTLLSEGLAIGLIEAPGAAGGLAVVHQDVVALPHPAIEVVLAQLLAAARPLVERRV